MGGGFCVYDMVFFSFLGNSRHFSVYAAWIFFSVDSRSFALGMISVSERCEGNFNLQ